MKNPLIFSFIAFFTIFLSIASVSVTSAQEPGSIISVGALGGMQGSSLTGIKSGQYYSLRGSFLNFFGELRHDDWGNSSSYVRDNGILGGIDFSLFHIMVAGAVGFGQSSYQAVTAVGGITPGVQSYSTFIYEGQAMYQFDIISGFMTAGIGVNYVAESNNIAPITGLGGVAMLSIGL